MKSFLTSNTKASLMPGIAKMILIKCFSARGDFKGEGRGNFSLKKLTKGRGKFVAVRFTLCVWEGLAHR